MPRELAVDAGHGGPDTGARGPRKLRVVEKTVTLAVARALVEELNRIPGVRGELTRDGDYFIPLRDRYQMAEKMKVKVRQIHWTMGRYDVVVVMEAPDDEALSRLMLSLSALGNVRSETLRAYSAQEMAQILKGLP